MPRFRDVTDDDSLLNLINYVNYHSVNVNVTSAFVVVALGNLVAAGLCTFRFVACQPT